MYHVRRVKEERQRGSWKQEKAGYNLSGKHTYFAVTLVVSRTACDDRKHPKLQLHVYFYRGLTAVCLLFSGLVHL